MSNSNLNNKQNKQNILDLDLSGVEELEKLDDAAMEAVSGGGWLDILKSLGQTSLPTVTNLLKG